MKLTKQQESEVMPIYKEWWHSYLNGDVKTYDHYLDQDYRFVGSTAAEDFLSKGDSTQFFDSTADQLAGKLEKRNTKLTTEFYDGLIFITELTDSYFLFEDEWTFYGKFRLSSILRKTSEGWRFIYQHFSVPDSKAQEGETIGFEQVSKENQELRDAIKRRTIELEQKNRELEIEAALERVRSRSMAMHKTEELADAIGLLQRELAQLEFALDNCIFWIINKESNEATMWLAPVNNTTLPEPYQVPFTNLPYFKGVFQAWELGNPKWTYVLEAEDKKRTDEYLFKQTDFKNFPTDLKKIFRQVKKTYISISFYNYGGLHVSTEAPINESQREILSRFSKVFDQTYTRFLDLQKAETQAREAQIEAALERVRSRSLAMHHSSELSAVVDTLLREFTNLEFTLTFCIINLIDEQDKSNTVWAANPETGTDPESYYMKFEDYPFHHAMWDAWKAQKKRFVYTIEGEEKKIYDEYLYSKTEFRRFPKHVQEANKSLERYVAGFTFFKYSGLQTVSEDYISEEDLDILEHFGRVFEQAYTRFLDLQKAEAQAQEAKIEVALEKVRARTMGMQRSDELAEVANVLFSEMNGLVHNLWTCGFVLCERDRKEDEWWLSLEDGFSRGFFLPNVNDYAHETLYEGWREGEAFRSVQLEGDKLQAHYDWLMEIPVAKKIFDDLEAAGMQRPEWQKLHAAYFSKGYLVIITREPCPEEEIFQRFAKVFDQTYTRFLDLQRAEAQGRESEIQLALERVRARTMAMQSSEELADAAFVLFEQLRNLGAKLWGTGFGLCEENGDKDEFWFANENGVLPPIAIPNTSDPAHKQMHKGWQEKTDFLCVEKSGAALKSHYDYMLSLPDVRPVFQKIIDEGLSFPERQQWNAAYFSKGYLLIITLEPYPEPEILKRFAKVFEQTYTRFLDLQKSEAQVREAQIQLSLERVRAKSMAMQSSDELHDVLSTLFQQFDVLGIKPVSVFLSLFDREKRTLTYRASGKSGMRISGHQTVSIDSLEAWSQLFDKWKNDNSDEVEVIFYTKEIVPTLFELLSDTFASMPAEERMTADDFPDGGYTMHGYTPFGYLGYNHTREATEEEKNILTRFATEFSRVYQRFLDIEKAEDQARESEIQLVLERVRASSLAMHKTDDLSDVVSVLFEEMKSLSVDMDFASVSIFIFEEGSRHINQWLPLPDGVSSLDIPYFDHPISSDLFDARESGVDYFEKVYTFEQKNAWLELGFELTDYKYLPEEFKSSLLDAPGYALSITLSKNSGICIPSFEGKLPSAEDVEILKRVGKVFEQAYIRFLDLQKAEAQAREAQIEAAVERIRAQSMAMHHTDDLHKVTKELLHQLNRLSVDGLTGTTIYLVDENDIVSAWDLSSPGSISTPDSYTVIYDAKKYPVLGGWVNEWRNTEQNYFALEFPKDTLLKAVEEWKEVHPEIAVIFKNAVDSGKLAHQWSPSGRLSKGILAVDLTKPPTEDTKDIVTKMSGAFNLAYQRFEDLQKAEAQAREAQIEAALEKVRSKSLAMQKSDELLDVITELSGQLQQLNVRFDFVSFGVISPKNEIDFWMAGEGYTQPELYHMPYFDHFVTNSLLEDQKKELRFTESTFNQKDTGEWIEVLYENNPHSKMLADTKHHTLTGPGMVRASVILKNICVFMGNFRLKPHSKEQNALLIRFANAFEQAYTRFLDLQRAEKQAREAQIEAALERVRSRSLAMHKSDELKDVVSVVFEKFKELRIPATAVGIGIAIPGSKDLDGFVCGENEAGLVITNYRLPYFDNIISKDLSRSLEEQIEYYVGHYSKAEKNDFYAHLFEHSAIKEVPEDIKQMIFDSPTYTISMVAVKNALFNVNDFEGKLLSESEIDIIKRFARVFDQTYTRFLDLQRAEKQAREAQIEASLERVRAQTMAMHNSENVGQCIVKMFGELTALGVDEGTRFGIGILNHENENNQLWTAKKNGEEVKMHIGNLDMNSHPLLRSALKAWREQVPLHKYVLEGKDLLNYYQMLNTAPHYKIQFAIKKLPKKEIHYGFIFDHGFFYAFTPHEFEPELIHIIQRFSSLFGQTYRRYLDLKRAEEQAREAQIEAALEKVRSRSLAMHKSDELNDVVSVVFEKIKELKIPATALGIAIGISGSKDLDAFVCGENEAGLVITNYRLPYFDNIISKDLCGALEKQTEYYVGHYSKAEKNDFYAYLFEHSAIKEVPEDIKQMIFESPTYTISTVAVKNAVFNVNDFEGKLLAESEIDIIKRFARVFDQTYTRFLDLQRAEKQARESQIELSLERIRSQVTSMQQSTDLFDIVVGMRSEFISLGHEADYFWHMRWLPDVYEMSMTSEDGHRLGMVINVPKFVHDQIPGLAKWEKGNEPIYVLALDVEGAWDYLENMNTHGHYKQADPNAPTYEDIQHIGGLTFVIARTTHGEIGYSLPGFVPHPPKKALDTLMRFAGVFDLAYKRFEDLQTAEKDLVEIKAAREKAEKALIKLKSAQDQLIQAEKLASLGQLTAGIAHEIKNPLNFVNNFSEVSIELIDEVFEELRKLEASDSSALIAEILEDVKSNLAKVHEHGSRADSIVKSMLQHSRGGSGIMEPTDLNALIKEYTNLAFHGMRAGKKPINVGIKLQLDPEIVKIPLMGEDFTRVMLNICNNAFDAMRETAALRTPQLIVRTKKTNKYISIEIEDNGPGISDDIKDKILQPFFTTKKGTDGTGLGLSITNDIIKVHGGSLNIQSKPGQTIFQIHLTN